MKRISDHIREHLLASLGVVEIRRRPSLEVLQETQWSSEFERYMRNRLVVGGIRYETFQEKRGGNSYDYLKEADRVLQDYRQTGNLELLVDLANYCLLEFVFGCHPLRYFEATDDGLHATKKEQTK